MNRFTRSYKVRFEDCDSAGIVFYPNYFLMLNRLIEDWFADELGMPWGIMHHERRMGVPTVQMQVSFHKASRLDELLEWCLEVRTLGNSSLTLAVTAVCSGELRLSIETVLVSVNLDVAGISSCDIPSDIRTGMERFLAAPAKA